MSVEEERSTAEWFKLFLDIHFKEIFLASKTTIGGGFVRSMFSFLGIITPSGWLGLDENEPITFGEFNEALENCHYRQGVQKKIISCLDEKRGMWTIDLLY